MRASGPGVRCRIGTRVNLAEWPGGCFSSGADGGDGAACDGLVHSPGDATLGGRDPALFRFLSVWDRSAGTLAGTGVRDWSRLPQRMSFIVNLFRTLHASAEVVRNPYGDTESGRTGSM